MERLIFLVLVLLCNSQSFAYQKLERFGIANPNKLFSKLIEDSDFAPSRLEKVIKGNLIDYKMNNPKRFYSLKNDRPNSALHMSFFNEVDEAVPLLMPGSPKASPPKGKSYYEHFMSKSQIAKARIIAKQKMYEAIKRNWPDLKNTIFNEFAFNDWESGKAFVTRVLNEKFYYVGRRYNNQYSFQLEGAGFVVLRGTDLKSGFVYLIVDPRLDSNKIPDWAMNNNPDKTKLLKANANQKSYLKFN